MRSRYLAADNNALLDTAGRWVGEYLVFQLGRENFGIVAVKVRTIMDIQDIKAVAQTPAHVNGVVHFHGHVIPVVDLRVKFDLPEIEFTQRTRVIVVDLQSPMLIGIVVDSVSCVLNLAANEPEPLFEDIEEMFTADELRELACDPSWSLSTGNPERM